MSTTPSPKAPPKIKKRNILILTAPVGGGHVATARVLTQALTERHGEAYNVTFCDVFEEVSLPLQFQKMLGPGYALSVKSMSAYPYRAFFDFADSNPDMVNRIFTAMFESGAIDIMHRYKPDIIVSTFPIISYIAARVVKESLRKHIPVISIVTDAGDVHRLWLMGVEDALLVSTPDTMDYAVKLGVPRDIVHYLGFPVAKSFHDLKPQKAARTLLGLKDVSTAVFSNGGLGLSPTKFLKMAKLVAKREPVGQVIFICGKNQPLYEKLAAMEFGPNVTIRGFVNNMCDYIAATDIVVGKAGWISLYEAMIARKPTIIFDVIPGQEQPNADFVERHKVGEVITSPADVIDRVMYYLQQPEALKPFKKNFADLDLDPHADEKIADFIVENF